MTPELMIGRLGRGGSAHVERQRPNLEQRATEAAAMLMQRGPQRQERAAAETA